MLLLQTIEDIRCVREGALLPASLLAEVEAYFKLLAERFTGEPDAWEAFDLSEYGHIVVLQPGVDDPGDLGICGLTRESGGLFGVLMEFVDVLQLDDLKVFRMVALLGTEFGLVIYSPVGGFGKTFDQYVSQFKA